MVTTSCTRQERLFIRHADANFCVMCEYYLTVVSEAGASFTLTSTSSEWFTVLAEGTPANEVVSKNEYEYFKLFVSRSNVDVKVVMTAFVGDPDVFLSTTLSKPNRTHFDFSSEEIEGDIISVRCVRFGCDNQGRALTV